MEEAAVSVLSGHEMRATYQSCSHAARTPSPHCSRVFLLLLLFFCIWIVPSQKQDRAVGDAQNVEQKHQLLFITGRCD